MTMTAEMAMELAKNIGKMEKFSQLKQSMQETMGLEVETPKTDGKKRRRRIKIVMLTPPTNTKSFLKLISVITTCLDFLMCTSCP